MSNTSLIIEERAADIGNFLVGRLLPFRQKRSVGPFVFLDHMGPANLPADQDFDILPHPHIGLSTLTYLFEGSIMHRDSIGSVQEIKPGAVNWMTAGKGIVHSERTPDSLRSKKKTMHGLQIWVALPKDKEEMEPSFAHVGAVDLPTIDTDGVKMKLIAGKAMGYESPVPVYSELFLIEIVSEEAHTINLGEALYGEIAIYVLDGCVETENQKLTGGKLLVAKNSDLCSLQIGADSKIFVFGGEPFPEERYINWNFVSSDKDRIKQAREDWTNQNLKAFSKIPGDDQEYVPYPKLKL